MHMESYWEAITPAMAQEYMRENAAGRSLNKNAVSMYARDMAAGRWRLTHQGIALDENGVLIDGQHRMAAIMRAGVPVTIWVTKGVARESFGVFDIGRGRSMADRFSIEGIAEGKHATQLAAVTRRATLWVSGTPWTRKFTPTRDEVAETFKAHPELADAAAFAHRWPARRTLAPALAGFCWWLFSTVDKEDAEYFMQALRTGEKLEKGDPILALRERLLGERAGRERASYAAGYQRQEVVLALAIIAWNHFRKRSRITKLQLPSSMSDESFPQPI
jgi:hypothetical protein